MGRFALAALGIAAYAVFLLALLPAGVVAERIARASQGAVQIENASGTAWRGSGQAVFATPAGPVAVDDLRWRILPAQLLRGRAIFSLQGSGRDYTLAGEIGRSFAAVEVPRLGFTAKASAAPSFVPLLAPWRPEGDLDLRLTNVTVDRSEMRGQVDLEWRDAAVAFSEVRPLGSYRLELRGEGGPARIRLSTPRGALRVQGEGTFAPPSRIVFKGEARADPAAAGQLQPLLDLFGPRRPDGARAIEWVVNAP